MNDPVTFDAEDRRFVYAVALRMVRSADDAEDVTQDALIRAYRHRESFRGDARYRTWLYRIATTAALGCLRSRRKARVELLDDGDDRRLDSVDPVKSADTLLEDAELRAAIERALATLTPAYRAVVLARVDATEPEVAKELGISIANVKIRTHRARKKLREMLERSAA